MPPIFPKRPCLYATFLPCWQLHCSCILGEADVPANKCANNLLSPTSSSMSDLCKKESTYSSRCSNHVDSSTKSAPNHSHLLSILGKHTFRRSRAALHLISVTVLSLASGSDRPQYDEHYLRASSTAPIREPCQHVLYAARVGSSCSALHLSSATELILLLRLHLVPKASALPLHPPARNLLISSPGVRIVLASSRSFDMTSTYRPAKRQCARGFGGM